jgi:hypothetical protein
MLDPGVVDDCMHCLVGAAVYDGTEADLSLTARALARDLIDTQNRHSAASLNAAAHAAARYLDACDLGTDAFAAALRRLASIRARVEAMLIDPSAQIGPLPL